MRKGRLWFRDSCGGSEWEHRFVDEPTLEKVSGGSCEAVTDLVTNTVYYDRALMKNVPRLRVIVVHEMLHRALSVPGHHVVIAGLLGCDEDEIDPKEENLCQYLSPYLTEALGASWKLPRFPK